MLTTKGTSLWKKIIVPKPWEEILVCKTPTSWIDRALNSLDVLLLDHAHCEKKAATTAIALIHRYPERLSLIHI